MTDQPKMTTPPPTKPVEVRPTSTKAVEPVQAKPTLSTTTLPPAPKEAVPMAIPDGAIDINLVRPGFGPLEGSPKENDPTVLANPNNPLSPVTRPQNPSNPANPPETQSEKPASEVRMFQALNPPVVLAKTTKAEDDRKAELKSLLEGIGDTLEEFGNESSIPPSHAYWGQVARHRVLSNP